MGPETETLNGITANHTTVKLLGFLHFQILAVDSLRSALLLGILLRSKIQIGVDTPSLLKCYKCQSLDLKLIPSARVALKIFLEPLQYTSFFGSNVSLGTPSWKDWKRQGKAWKKENGEDYSSDNKVMKSFICCQKLGQGPDKVKPKVCFKSLLEF